MRGSVVVQLIQYARDAARRAQATVSSLTDGVKDLEERITDAKATLHLAKTVVSRLDDFEPQIGDDYQCPICWISEGIRADLSPIPSATDADLFRCKNCHREVLIENPK